MNEKLSIKQGECWMGMRWMKKKREWEQNYQYMYKQYCTKSLHFRTQRMISRASKFQEDMPRKNSSLAGVEFALVQKGFDTNGLSNSHPNGLYSRGADKKRLKDRCSDIPIGCMYPWDMKRVEGRGRRENLRCLRGVKKEKALRM